MMPIVGFIPSAISIAFPVVVSTTQGNSGANVSTFNVPLPATITAGDLLIATVISAGDREAFWPAGWSILFGMLNSYSCAYRIADGTEGGGTVAVSFEGGGGVRVISQVQRITGAASDILPDFVTGNTGVPLNTNAPNPLAVTPLWGSSKNLFFVNCSVGAGDGLTSYPANYTHHQNEFQDGGNNCRLATCSRQLEAASDDPGAFAFTASNPKAFGTIAIAPTGASVPGARIAGSMTSQDATNGTNHVIALPQNIVAGDLVIVLMLLGISTTYTMPAGWTTLENTIGTNTGMGIIYRECTGSEGANITVTSPGSQQIHSIALKIRGHASGVAPEKGTLVQATNTAPNSPAVTPSWGSMQNLFIVLCNRGNLQLPSAWPANYNKANVATFNIGASRTLLIGARSLAASTDDPGTFTFAGSAVSQTQTIVVKPA